MRASQAGRGIMSWSATDRSEILFLAHRIPYPPNKGEKIRAFHEIRHLAEAGWRVHLCTLADDPADIEHRLALKRWCASVYVESVSRALQKARSLAGPVRGLPLSVPYFYRPGLQRRVDQVLERYAVRAVLCFSGPMAEYVFRSESRRLSERLAAPNARRLKGRQAGRGARNQSPSDEPWFPRLVMDLVDVDSDKWRQYSHQTRWPMSWVYRLESALLSRYERRVAERFDATVLVSEAEAETFRSSTGLGGKIHAVGNGVDLDYFHPQGPGEARGTLPPSRRAAQPPGDQAPAARLVFCGAMDYLPNVDAVVWFAREVLPLVRRDLPDTVFTIVGSNPAPEVAALARLPGVTVTGRVPDVRPHVRGASLSVAPIRIARGVQNKVLEAMAMGKPVVVTPRALEGIEAAPGRDIVVAPAEPRAFAGAVTDLLLDPARAAELAKRARAAVEKAYRWQTRLKKLEDLLDPDAGRGPAT